MSSAGMSVVDLFLLASTVWLMGTPKTAPSPPPLLFESEIQIKSVRFLTRFVIWIRKFRVMNFFYQELDTDIMFTSEYPSSQNYKIVRLINKYFSRIINISSRIENTWNILCHEVKIICSQKTLGEKWECEWYQGRIWWCTEFPHFYGKLENIWKYKNISRHDWVPCKITKS